MSAVSNKISISKNYSCQNVKSNRYSRNGLKLSCRRSAAAVGHSFLQNCLISEFKKFCNHRKSRLGLEVVARREGPPVLIPSVPLYEGSVDVINYLKCNRIIFIGTPIDDKVCTNVVADMLALEAVSPGEEIKIYLNSPEGSPYHVMAIIDVMKQLKCPVSTVGFGIVGGVSALLLAAGTKGKRSAMPHTRILIHQPMGGAMGSSFEVKIQATELSRNMKMICKWYSIFSGKDEDVVREEIDRDNFMSPSEAVEWGILDSVLN
mmetsp:Transcript_13375/g.18278  ORF Transcript_13375/g.18278 Transcript_13375/m.18278 type:complete len:263 (-) Transcript_13375:158-946(-)|eukprot:CAMPEP_0196578986 /NCGR_PEP_ID=MMETSP1081-20130531/15301_1 /TAXON_ID=36882 /ORGANISM="Pyramimonas amylifera, Strain CCMP720" /LENGTH=262 /DNA_ID=CAMNT_0041898405 /DNA_START=141 /DNA_END=929 /DNA_ORIENTATION=+